VRACVRACVCVQTDSELEGADEVVNVAESVDELRVFEREVADVAVCLRSGHQLNHS